MAKAVVTECAIDDCKQSAAGFRLRSFRFYCPELDAEVQAPEHFNNCKDCRDEFKHYTGEYAKKSIFCSPATTVCGQCQRLLCRGREICRECLLILEDDLEREFWELFPDGDFMACLQQEQ